MKPELRQKELLSILRAMQKELHVDDLARILGVSTLTVRRDLQQLTKDNAVIRTHGGCIAVGRAALETEYHKKVALNFELKQAIGKAAATLVKPGDVLLVSDGSTTFHLVTSLGGRGPLTVYTNSLAMISELGRYHDIALYILGGFYNPDFYTLSGSLTERMIESLYFDKIFLGVDAVDDDGRCMVASLEESRLTQIMLRSGAQKILLADHTKVGGASYIAYGNLGEFDMWITTSGMSPEMYEKFSKKTHIVEAQP